MKPVKTIKVLSGKEPEQEAKEGYVKLYDRADGVKGHFCVGRDRGGYSEYWTGKEFGGFGKLYTDKEDAQSIADLLNEINSLKSSPPTQEQRPKDEDEFYRYLLHEITDYEKMRNGWKEGSAQFEAYELMVRQLRKVKSVYVSPPHHQKTNKYDKP